MTKSERPRRGCRCRCGEATYSTYAPGHDARHLSRLFLGIIASDDRWTAYRDAMQVLSSEALRGKLRARLIGHFGNHNTAREMVHSDWQRTMALDSLIRETDPALPVGLSVGDTAALAAAAGWSRSSVNRRRS